MKRIVFSSVKKLLLFALLFIGGTQVSAQGISEEDLAVFKDISNGTFDNVSIHKETGILTLDVDINNILSDKSGIEFFSDDIYSFFKNRKELPYMPYGVVFRGYAKLSDSKVAVAVYYYDEQNANRDWSNVTMLSTDMYKLTDYKSVVVPFSRYLDNYTTQINVDENNPIDNALMRMTLMSKP